MRSTIPEQLRKATTIDQWITPTNPEDVFTTSLLGFITDMQPTPFENLLSNSPFSVTGSALRAQRHEKAMKSGDTVAARAIEEELTPWPTFYYPTLNLSLDVVRELPTEGVKWLFVRTTALELRSSNMSIVTTLLDERGALVARAMQKALVISGSKL